MLNHCAQVGDYLAKRINEFVPTVEKPHFVLGLPTGSSPLPTYHRLVHLFEAGKLSFKVSTSLNVPYPVLTLEHSAERVDLCVRSTDSDFRS